MKRTTAPAGSLPEVAAGPPLGDDIARYLDLFGSQVAVCAQESDEPVSTLVQGMLAVADSTREMLAAAQTGSADAELQETVERNCLALLERVQLAVVAFQFHDLLTQRLRHVSDGMAELAHTLRDPARRNNPDYWASVGQRIRDRYSLTEQRNLFDELVKGVTGDAADTAALPANGRGGVELF